MSNISTYKAKIYKGSLPEQGLEYWTKQDWKDHRNYVKKLKLLGEYLKEEKNHY